MEQTILDLSKSESTQYDLVARVVCADPGSVNHDTEVSWVLSAFDHKEVVTEQDLIEELEKDGSLNVFFVRWEEPGDWSML